MMALTGRADAMLIQPSIHHVVGVVRRCRQAGLAAGIADEEPPAFIKARGDRIIEPAQQQIEALLPQQRIVFQGDMFIIPRNDASSGPPAPTTLSFAKKLEGLRLNVDRIAGVHGRSATIEELRTRLQD